MNDETPERPKGNKTKKAPRFRIPWPSLEQTGSVAKLMFQLTATAGGLLLLMCCVKAGHYPAGSTIGDVLLLLATSVATATIYSLIVAVLYGFGMLVTQAMRWVFNWQSARLHKERANESDTEEAEPARSIPKLDPLEWLMCAVSVLISLLLIPRFWAIQPFTLWSVLTCIFLIGVLRACYPLVKQDKRLDRRSKRDVRIVIATTIYFIPALTGLVLQLDLPLAALRLIGVRKEHVTIFVAKQRALLIDDELQQSKSTKILGDYHKYENANVLMRGIGAESVIEIGNRRWIIPNDQFTLSYPSKAEITAAPPGH